MYVDIIAWPFRKKLYAGISLFLLALVLINSAFFYHYIDRVLGELYSQKVSTASYFKAELIRDTLSIYGLFALICLFGIVAVVILSTHRVVGPLVGVKRVAARMAEGGLDATARFRKKDAVLPLADALNELTTKYRERHSNIREAIEELYQDTCELSLLVRNGDPVAAEDKRLEMLRKVEEVNKWLSGIKV